MKGYRKEQKYIVGDDQLADVANRISPLMRRDIHQKGDHYRVRSVYFDSPTLECYRQNMAGVSPREKYRIRTYDCSSDTISAEIKIRHRDTISKMTARIGRDLYDRLVFGDRAARIEALLGLTGEDKGSERVFEKYLMRIMNGMYRPVCIIDYERSAYVYDIGNVRITFDRNVTVSEDFAGMFEARLPGRAVLADNRHILEIKYDEFLPDEIAAVLGGMGLCRCSCSKYALAQTGIMTGDVS